jgi:hypothetical protein
MLIEARAVVFNPLFCQDLNNTARRVLFGILTFLNLRDARKAVFPRRDLLRAESLLNSEATLYRGLKLLVDKGYITRSQCRRAFGEFHLSPIALTSKALAMLGLDGVIHRERPLKVRDRYIKKEHTKPEQSLQNTAGSGRKPEMPSDESARNVGNIDPHTGLPKELLRLLSMDLRKGTICWLMLQARMKGHRLGDIVAGVWHRIHSLRGRQLVAYLSAMMTKPIDFAWIARQRTETVARDTEQHRAKALLEGLGARHHGCEVIGRDGRLYGVFEASDSGTHAVIAGHGAMPVNLAFAKALLKGDLRLDFARQRAALCEA